MVLIMFAYRRAKIISVLDGDVGPNIGGMGVYCPAPVVTPEVNNLVGEIIKPMFHYLSNLMFHTEVSVDL